MKISVYLYYIYILVPEFTYKCDVIIEALNLLLRRASFTSIHCWILCSPRMHNVECKIRETHFICSNIPSLHGISNIRGNHLFTKVKDGIYKDFAKFDECNK